MYKILSILTLVLLLCISANSWGQAREDSSDSTKIYKIELKDGSTIFGNILQKDVFSIVIKTPSIPRLEIQNSAIKHIEVVEEGNFKEGVYWFPNPHPTRYLYAPSAFNLKKGEAYYQNTFLILNSFNVGLNDYFSIGAGLEMISTFGSITSGGLEPIFFITPKVSFPVREKFRLGAGLLYINIPNFDSESTVGSLGIAYGVGTYGSLDHNITGGLGWGFVGSDFQQRPFITVSGMTRLSRKTALVSENWLIPTEGYYGVFSYGIRLFSEKMAVDLAFINNPDIAQAIIIGIPFVSFTVKF